jgi:hypothetical protein
MTRAEYLWDYRAGAVAAARGTADSAVIRLGIGPPAAVTVIRPAAFRFYPRPAGAVQADVEVSELVSRLERLKSFDAPETPDRALMQDLLSAVVALFESLVSKSGAALTPDEHASAASMSELADAIARETPAVDVEPREVPVLTDNPVNDARALFNLTFEEFARLFDITERQAHRWANGGVPAERRTQVDALISVGLILVGSLGADGSHAWLQAGEPTSADLLRGGDVEALVARADALRDSPAT